MGNASVAEFVDRPNRLENGSRAGLAKLNPHRIKDPGQTVLSFKA